MRAIKVLIFVFFTTYGWGQTTYNSSHTIHMPSKITEEINRTITFSKDNDYILIKSFEGGEPIHQQLMVIKESFEKITFDGVYQIFECVSLHEVFPTRVFLKRMNPEYISVIQPSKKEYGTETYHLMLEKIQ